MTLDEIENDPLFGAVATLKTQDVHQRRAELLRRRCHIQLETRARRGESAVAPGGVLLRRAVGPAAAVVWCIAYLLEIIHRAATVYRF